MGQQLALLLVGALVGAVGTLAAELWRHALDQTRSRASAIDRLRFDLLQFRLLSDQILNAIENPRSPNCESALTQLEALVDHGPREDALLVLGRDARAVTAILKFYAAIASAAPAWRGAVSHEDDLIRKAAVLVGRQVQLSCALADLVLADRRPGRRLQLLFKRKTKMSEVWPEIEETNKAATRSVQLLTQPERERNTAR